MAGYSGEGMVHAWMNVKELAYMVSGKDVDWLPTHFTKMGKGKHRVAPIYVGKFEQSIPRLRASAHPLRPFILILPPRSYYTGLWTALLPFVVIESLSRSFTSVLLPSNAVPSAHLFKTLLLRHATNSSISHQWTITPSPAPCRTTLKSTLFFLLTFQNQPFSLTLQLIVTLKEPGCYDAIPLTITTLPLQRWIEHVDTLFNRFFVVPSNEYLSHWHDVLSTIDWNGMWTMRMCLVAM